MLFSWYINKSSPHFGVTYGSRGDGGFHAVVWFSAMVVLVGAELNAEIGHQPPVTHHRLTGADRQARAVIADTVGKAFTVSPREPRHYVRDFLKRQIAAVGAWGAGSRGAA